MAETTSTPSSSGSGLKIGYKLAAEAFDPKEVVRQAVAAERAGFDFVEVSDHFHPWVEAQGHSGFAFAMLANAAAKTERIGLVTGVTCPSYRYHPAVVAQAAATLQILSDGRFTLGVGAGERLNEHVIGEPAFRGVHERHERFRESLEIIRLLWSGGYHSYSGKHLQLEDARVFDLPEQLPVIAVAGSGPASAKLAADLGDGLFGTEPDAGFVSAWKGDGGSGPVYGEVPLAWAPTEDAAVDAVLEKSAWALTGWKVMAELPNPVNFEAAAGFVTRDDVLGQFACGPDLARHVANGQQFVDAGYDHLVTQNAGPDPDGFLEFASSELIPAWRELTPSSSS